MVAHPNVEPPRPRPLSRAEYHRMGELGFFRGERVELVGGTVVRMSPIGPAHASAVQRLAELLLPRLLGRATVRIQQPLLACDDSEPEPDLAIVPLAPYAERHPDRALLVVEVADSSLEYDLGTKAALYAGSRVDEYWVVDLAARCVHVHTRPAGRRFEAVERRGVGQLLQPTGLPEVVVGVALLVG